MINQPHCTGGSGHNDRETGKIGKVVGYERQAKVTYVKKAEERADGGEKEERSREQPTRAFSLTPDECEESERGEWKKVLPPNTRVDFPPRIIHGKTVRKKKLAEVKPKCASGNENSLHQRQIEFSAFGSTERAFHPSRQHPDGNSQCDKWHERLYVAAPFDPTALPPNQNESDCG